LAAGYRLHRRSIHPELLRDPSHPWSSRRLESLADAFPRVREIEGVIPYDSAPDDARMPETATAWRVVSMMRKTRRISVSVRTEAWAMMMRIQE
jgi:hypothetical protein